MNGHYDVYVVNANGGEPSRLTTNAANDAVPSWSGDGRWVYFSSDRTGSSQVWKVPATGGQPVQITRDGGFGGFESSDSALFYFAKTPGRPTKLWSVSVNGGPETEVFSGLKSWANFTVAAEGIYFRPENPAPVGFYVQFFDFRTREVRTVREVKTRPGSGFAVAPGAAWMLFAAKEFRRGDLVMVENLP
jgi:dipeptidyl aminopeptidase/acylaminoacyl peptidase